MSGVRTVSPPPDLCEEGRALWRLTLRHLRAQDTWSDADGPALERYVRAVMLYRDARKAADAEPFVAGSRGQLVAHPGAKVAREAALDADKFAAALLLTPAARKRASVSVETGDDLLAAIS